MSPCIKMSTSLSYKWEIHTPNITTQPRSHPRLNLILPKTLKPRPNLLTQPFEHLAEIEDRLKCPHFTETSSLPRSETQTGSHKDSCTRTHPRTHTLIWRSHLLLNVLSVSMNFTNAPDVLSVASASSVVLSGLCTCTVEMWGLDKKTTPLFSKVPLRDYGFKETHFYPWCDSI